jgi:hypothetical protein
MSSRLLYRVSFLYLALPVVIFLLTWLRLWLGLICALVVVLALIQVWRERQGDSRLERRGILGGLLLLALWAWLSGVGGYAFQNSDHYCRNAVLRDLVNYSWAVVYRETVGGSPQMLVYYFGHWLPAALVGKWLGWEAANAALFVWTWAGVVLAGLLLGQRLRWPLWNAALLWIFFSSMDALAILLFVRGRYPSLWPPVQHLEAWAMGPRYSSFTTQLFWVYNQAVPA